MYVTLDLSKSSFEAFHLVQHILLLTMTSQSQSLCGKWKSLFKWSYSKYGLCECTVMLSHFPLFLNRYVYSRASVVRVKADRCDVISRIGRALVRFFSVFRQLSSNVNIVSGKALPRAYLLRASRKGLGKRCK